MDIEKGDASVAQPQSHDAASGSDSTQGSESSMMVIRTVSDDFAPHDLSIDPKYLSDANSTIAEMVAVAHPEAVADQSQIRSGLDDVPLESLRNMNLKGKPVTLDHGDFDIKKQQWIRKPKVVGHVIDTKLDEDGRLLAYFVLHRSNPGFVAESEVWNRIKVDVSPMFFIGARPNKDGKLEMQYHCNHLSLTPEGRRYGTHILAARSAVRKNAEHMRLKDQTILNTNKTTRKAADVLFERDLSAVRDFFAGMALV